MRKPTEVSKITQNNKDKIELRENELDSYINKTISEKVNSILGEKSRLNESAIFANNLTDRIQVQVIQNISSTNRVYKLTANLKFEMFEDYLRSDLKTKRLAYILDEHKCASVSETKLTDDKERVRDIIINHIDIKYYTKIVELREPREILSKLREYKRLETRVSSVSARKDLYSLKFNFKKERAAEFWDKFEEKVKVYENVPEVGKMTEKEKRDIFIHAVVESVPGV